MATITKNKAFKAILLIILIIGFPLFLAIYEQLFLAYYQESIADSWAGYFVKPLFVISLIYLAIEKYKAFNKSESKKIMLMLRKALLEAFIFFIFFIYILRPIISGAIIMINANVGSQKEEIVTGLIIAKRDFNGVKSHEYKLTIQTDSDVLIFQTDSKVIVTHDKGDTLREAMNRGSLGLLYKK